MLARTDARQAVGLEEALWRPQAFADLGADVVFIDVLESREELEAFCSIQGALKMANMLEGGHTPILSTPELQEMGFKILAYPLSLLGASIHTMSAPLSSLHSSNTSDGLSSFQVGDYRFRQDSNGVLFRIV